MDVTVICVISIVLNVIGGATSVSISKVENFTGKEGDVSVPWVYTDIAAAEPNTIIWYEGSDRMMTYDFFFASLTIEAAYTGLVDYDGPGNNDAKLVLLSLSESTSPRAFSVKVMDGIDTATESTILNGVVTGSLIDQVLSESLPHKGCTPGPPSTINGTIEYEFVQEKCTFEPSISATWTYPYRVTYTDGSSTPTVCTESACTAYSPDSEIDVFSATVDLMTQPPSIQNYKYTITDTTESSAEKPRNILCTGTVAGIVVTVWLQLSLP